MLISNGVTTRNIAEEQLPEYKAKGYEVVKKGETSPSLSIPKKTATKKTGDK